MDVDEEDNDNTTHHHSVTTNGQLLLIKMIVYNYVHTGFLSGERGSIHPA